MDIIYFYSCLFFLIVASHGQVGAMDRALLQMCAIDDVMLDSTSTVVRYYRFVI